MTAGRFIPPVFSPNNDSGSASLPGALLYFYVNGSSSTLQNTYSDFALTTPHANPVVADGDGRFAEIFGNNTYSVKLTDADGNNVWGPFDNITLSATGGVDDATNSGVSTAFSITHTTTGTPAAGIGVRQGWIVETATSNNEIGLTIDAISTSVTAGSETFKAVFSVMNAGTLTAFLDLTPTSLSPSTTDTLGLGTTTSMWADAFFASGAVVNFNNGDITLTHSANTLTMAGGTLAVASFKGTGAVTVTDILDEDTMSSDSETALATQQSIKAYVDAASLSTVAITLDERTSNTILGVADKSSFINITSGTFTQTFDAVATLGAGWYAYIKNSGTGDITLDPDGSEQIDGLTSFIMYPGEARIIQCDGSKFTTILLEGFKRTYTATDTFTTPPGYSAFAGLAWSAGGSGGSIGFGGGNACTGGGGGGCFPFNIESSLFGASETITIGAGGSAISTLTDGNAGGTTSIGSLLTIYGGGAGIAANVEAPGGSIGYSAAVSTAAVAFGFASAAKGIDTAYGGTLAASDVDSGDSIYGGGAGGSFDSSNTLRAAGGSLYGGAGGAANTSASATDGTVPGGGGGSVEQDGGITYVSGAGARGEVRIHGIL